MNRYRIHAHLNWNADLVFSVILLDGDSGDIDTVWETDTLAAARQWTAANGSLVEAECPRCGNIQYEIWEACQQCGNPALIGYRPLSERVQALTDIRRQIGSGNGSRDLDATIAAAFAIDDTAKEYFHAWPGEAPRYTAVLQEAARLFVDQLPGWHLNIGLSGEALLALNGDTAEPNEIFAARVTISEQRDGSDYSAVGPTPSLALLDTIMQAMIAREGDISVDENNQSE